MKKFILIINTLLPFYLYAETLTEKQTQALIEAVDQRQRNVGDYNSTVFIDQKEAKGTDKSFEAQVYRRDADNKWMILFTKPKTEAGKGYLRVDKNLFLYEPALGKWERQTERASIAGTNSRRDDFDQSRLAIEYTNVFVGEETLGKKKAYRIKLTAKKDVEVASTGIELWIDKEDGNVLKRQEFSQSGGLLRTSYYPEWTKTFSKSKNADVFVPKRILVFDEIQKGNATTIVLQNVSLEPLDANMFTKAWIEKKSR